MIVSLYSCSSQHNLGISVWLTWITAPTLSASKNEIEVIFNKNKWIKMKKWVSVALAPPVLSRMHLLIMTSSWRQKYWAILIVISQIIVKLTTSVNFDALLRLSSCNDIWKPRPWTESLQLVIDHPTYTKLGGH